VNNSVTGIKGVYFVLVVIFIDCLGLGLIMPVMPDLIMEVSGENVSRAAYYGGWMMFVYATMQFLCAPVLGNLSDRFGRRPILLISMFGLFIDYVILMFAGSLLLLFVGRFLGGLFGASFSTANAYIADVTTAENRAHGFGLTGGAFGLGFILGPVLGGVLGEVDSRLPFKVAAALALLNCVYGYFILPESLSAEKRRAFSWARANAFGALQQILKRPELHLLLLVLFLHQFAFHANPSVWSYYTIEKFEWSQAQIGISFAVIGFFVALVQVVFVGRIVKRFGERKALLAGLIMTTLGCIGFAAATSGLVLLLVIPVWCCSGLTLPSLQSLITRLTSDEEQGDIQGIMTSVYSLTAMFSPVLMTQLFYRFSAPEASTYLPGAPFYFAALLAASALTVVLVNKSVTT